MFLVESCSKEYYIHILCKAFSDWPGVVHDNPGDGCPGGVSGAVTASDLDLDLANLVTSRHFLHLTSMTSLCCLSVRYWGWTSASGVTTRTLRIWPSTGPATSGEYLHGVTGEKLGCVTGVTRVNNSIVATRFITVSFCAWQILK